MKRFFLVIFMLILYLSAVLSGCGSVYEREYYKGFDTVFGSDLSIRAELLGKNAPQAFLAMVSECKEIDRQVSLTRTESDLSKLNAAAPGEPVEAGEHTGRLFDLSRQYFTDTDGAFNPQLSRLSELWRVDAGNNANFKKTVAEPALPDYETVVLPLLPGFSEFAFEKTDSAEDGKCALIKKTDSARLDFGAVAKGYAADRCIEIAKEYGIVSAIVDLAGNIKTLGGSRAGKAAISPFTVSITDPRPNGGKGSEFRERLVVLSAAEQEWSVSVSGDYERFYCFEYGQNDTVPVCHILNPKTGMPLGVTHDGSRYRYDSGLSVIAAAAADKNSALADAYSTAVCVLGYEEGKKLLIQNKVCGVVMTEEKIAFIGISASEFYKPDEYGTLDKYGENIEYLGF